MRSFSIQTLRDVLYYTQILYYGMNRYFCSIGKYVIHISRTTFT